MKDSMMHQKYTSQIGEKYAILDKIKVLKQQKSGLIWFVSKQFDWNDIITALIDKLYHY